MNRKLVVLHIDGVSAAMLQRAMTDGRMPFVQKLISEEGYEVLGYRCGVPSTTPFAQAGILYGNNSEIPSFRWWDRERQVLVQFGAGSTFKKVADKYFEGCRPLTEGGACIAACYPAAAADDFGIAYQDRSYSHDPGSRSAWHVLGPYLANPLHIGDWLWQTVAVVARTGRDVIKARAGGRHPARAYVITDVVEEIFVHHLTRYAVQKAMREGFSPIYAGFYAFDETAHAFGPGDQSSANILKQVDGSIEAVASSRGDQYEMLVLSDHGQVDSVPFADGRGFGETIAGLMPGCHVEEMKGGKFGPEKGDAALIVYITKSGGLAHVYFADRATRMSYGQLMTRQPNLARDVSALEEVAFVMARDGGEDVFVADGRELRGPEMKQRLEPYDDPDILLRQLSRLNSFETAGDLVVFGAFERNSQVNFEDQAGGHGSIGGEQLHPFVLAKREWALDTSGIQGAHELYPMLSRLRDRLLEGGLRSGTP